MITQIVKRLNIDPAAEPLVIRISQYDVLTNGLKFYLDDGIYIFNESNCTAKIQGTKPDKKGFSYDATYTTGSSNTSSTVTCNITEQMSCVPGDVICEIKIMRSIEVLFTKNFILKVEPAALADDVDISETVLPEYIDAAQRAAQEAASYVNSSEAWARGTRDGVPVTSSDETYQNNSKYYADQSGLSAASAGTHETHAQEYAANASSAATAAAGEVENSEAYARGTRGGTPVSLSDVTYHNNSKYYSEQASDSAAAAAASVAQGTQVEFWVQGGILYVQQTIQGVQQPAVALGSVTSPNTDYKFATVADMNTAIANDEVIPNGMCYVAEAGGFIFRNENGTAVCYASLQTVGTRASGSTVGNYSFTAGINNQATAYGTIATGNISKATALYAQAHGYQCQASAKYAHAEGDSARAEGEASHAEGQSTHAEGAKAHAEGYGTYATALTAHAEGYNSNAYSSAAHAEGFETVAGNSTTPANGNYAHAEGGETTASGKASHAEGSLTVASGSAAHAEGCGVPQTPTAEAKPVTASGNFSHAEGYATVASAEGSHAEGMYSTASGTASHAAGYYTKASGNYQHAGGKYNVEKTGSDDYIVIGNGTTDNARSNCFRVYTTAVYGNGAYNSSGADYAEYFEWADANSNREDRAGRFVTLDGDKIKLADPEDDFILGIVSGNASVIGDSFDDQWAGMYERDIFGRYVFEDAEIPEETDEMDGETVVISPAHTEHRLKLNPEYDGTQVYMPRSERAEWDAVGMIGKLVALDDGTCEVNGYCKPSDGGIATAAEGRTRYRVMKRLDESHIQIVIV